jgi:hypothetical protein
MTALDPATPATASSASVATEPSPRLHWGWWVAFGTLCIGFASVAADSALHFNDSPIDGPFQLFNALRRLSAGQKFGGTFQFFHGLGIPYLHLIPFYLFGGDFLASEMARHVVSVVAALAVFACFFRAWTGSWRSGVPLTVAALILLVPLHVDALLFPINSMLGIRSTMPLVVAIHLYLRPTGWRAMIERAALLAIAMLCGIDQGTATIAAFLVVETILAIRRREAGELARATMTVALAGTFFILMLIVMTPKGFASVLKFNFQSLPGDQFWYFGGPPNRFLFRWAQLRILFQQPVWPVAVVGMVGWVLVRFWRGSTGPEARAINAETFLAVYALLSTASMLGVLAMVYFQPAVRVALILALIAARREWARWKDELPIGAQLRHRAPIYATLLVIGYSAAAAPLPMITLIRTPLHLAYAHGFLGEAPVMSGAWSKSIAVGQATVDERRATLHREPTIWSTYASYLEWEMGVFHPSFDYIIHALGPANRAAYAATFVARRPDIVQTLAPTFTMYEEWLEVNHWEFYRPLLRDYTIAFAGPWSYFWFRRPASFDDRLRVIADTPVPPGRLAIAIDGCDVPKDSIGLFEVTLHYHVVNPWRRMPVIGSLPRYLVTIFGAANHTAISLSPYALNRRFPVLTVGPTEIQLAGEVREILGSASLVFDSIRVERLAIAPENRQWAMDFIKGPRRDTLITKQP